MADDTKTIFESKTVWGVLVILVAVFARRWFGVELAEEDRQAMLENLGVLGGAALAIYGRLKAIKKVSGV